MGLIKEPEGITFYVENRDLTKAERKMLSEFFAKQNKKANKNIEIEAGRKKSIGKHLNSKKNLT